MQTVFSNLDSGSKASIVFIISNYLVFLVLKLSCSQLLDKHKTIESMVELLDLYQMEDEAYSSLAEATTELYQYLLQPFRDMRELAMLRRQQIKVSFFFFFFFLKHELS